MDPNPPSLREDRPWLEGANAFVRDRLWPELRRLQADYPTRIKVDERREYWTVAGFFFAGVFLTFVLAAAGSMLAFLMVPAMIVGFIVAGTIVSRKRAARATQEAAARAMEKQVVGQVAGFLGFDYRETPAEEQVAEVKERMRAVGLFEGVLKGEGKDGFWTDQMAFEHETFALTAWDVLYSGHDVPVRTINALFEGLAVLIPLRCKRIDAEVVGYGRGAGYEAAHVAMLDLDRRLPDGFQPVELESPVFRRTFDIRATDQVAARYLLTPAFMGRLVEAGTVMEAKATHLAFADGALLLLFHTRRDPFEFGSGASLLEPEAVRRLFAELSALLDLADVLALEVETAV